MISFIINVPTYGGEITIDFKEKLTNTSIVTFANLTDSPYLVKVCINTGIYILSLTSLSEWDENHYVSITFNGEEKIYRCTGIESTFELSFLSFIYPTSLIQRSDVYLENWYKIPTIDWPAYLNKFPERRTTTTYYKFEFYFDYTFDPFSYILCKLISDGAVVIFLNGHLLYRRGLGEDYFRSDYSKHLYSSAEIKTIKLNANALIIGKNALGIEVHKYSTSQQRDPFRLIDLTLISDDEQCTITNTYNPPMLIKNNRGYEYLRELNDGVSRAPMHVVNNLNNPRPFSDSVGDGFWYDEYLVWDSTPIWYGSDSRDNAKNDYINATGILSVDNPLDITMGYPNNIAETFTQYSIQTGPDNPHRDPIAWKVYGSYDNITGDWDLLQDITHSNITTGRFAFATFQFHNQYQSYEYYRFAFTRYRANDLFNGIQLARLYLYHCKPRYCNEDGVFPRSRAGFTASVPCQEGYTGSKDRNCFLDENERPYWGSIEDNCRELEAVLLYSSGLLFYKGYPNEINPIYDSWIKPIRFETNCSFPNGISLNPTNGIISGISNENLTEKIFVKRLKCNISLVNEIKTINKVFEFTYKSKNITMISSDMSII